MIEHLEPIPVGTAENLIGQRFGHLIVLYRVKNKSNRTTWQCLCDCGNYITVIGKALKNKSTISCGCARNKGHIKDHTGERYGSVKVIKMYPKRASDGSVLWECQCDCGNIVLIRASNLKKTKRCNKCFRGKDITGQRFGSLTAIKYHHTSPSKASVWECRCDCGALHYVNISDLTSGKTQSCGCIKSQGEYLIAKILTENNLTFEKQKSFKTCLFPDTGALALFDFFVNNNYLIEFDGIQHFTAVGGWNNESNLIKTQEHDKIKNEWCKKNNIQLIRIPYTALNQLTIKDLLIETSKFII